MWATAVMVLAIVGLVVLTYFYNRGEAVFGLSGSALGVTILALVFAICGFGTLMAVREKRKRAK